MLIRPRSKALRFAAILVLASTASACAASEERFATETAGSNDTALLTATHTPSGDLLMIDGEPVLRVYVPEIGGPAQYALTSGWLYRKDNQDWIASNAAADDRSIVVDPSRPDRLFRGDHPVCSEEVESDPIIFSKSIDGGDTWRAIPGGDNIQPLIVDPTLGDVIYGSDCGLAISTDAGETWRAYYRSRGHTVVDAVVVGERLLVLEISETGRGRVRAINVTVPEDPELDTILFETGHVFDLDARPEQIIVAGMEGIAVSVDNGKTWTTSRKGIEEMTLESIEKLPPQGTSATQPAFGVLAVRLDPINSRRIFAGTVRGLYISQDAGLTWDSYSKIELDARVLDIQFAAGGNDVYVTTPDGVFLVPNP